MFDNNNLNPLSNNMNSYAKVQGVTKTSLNNIPMAPNLFTKDEMRKKEEEAYAKKEGYNTFSELVEARHQVQSNGNDNKEE